MRVLVTGGAGYIGSVAVERLLAAGYDVTVLDSLSMGHASAIPADVPLLRIDLRDAEAVLTAMQAVRPDAVLHFGARAVVPESMSDPATYYQVNTVGSLNLLEAMRAADVNRIVFSSTAAVYGVPERLPIREEDRLLPINPYGHSKLMVERFLQSYSDAYGIRYAAMRYFNVAGASPLRGEDHRPESHVIPVALFTAMGKRETFQVFGTDYPTRDGTAIRDYVHVIDLVDAHLLALGKLDRSLGAFNLGTLGGFTVQEIVQAVEKVTDRPLPVTYAPRREGDPPELVADASRAHRELGWTPAHSTLDQMIGSAWEWFQAHPDGYEDLP